MDVLMRYKIAVGIITVVFFLAVMHEIQEAKSDNEDNDIQ